MYSRGVSILPQICGNKYTGLNTIQHIQRARKIKIYVFNFRQLYVVLLPLSFLAYLKKALKNKDSNFGILCASIMSSRLRPADNP